MAVVHILELWAFGNQVPWQIHRETGHLAQRFAFLAWNMLLPSATTVAHYWTAASYICMCVLWMEWVDWISQPV